MLQTEFSQVEIRQFDRMGAQGQRTLGGKLDPVQFTDVRIGK